MGFMKRFIGQEYLLMDGQVCIACFSNVGIKKFIKENRVEGSCSYCKRKYAVAEVGEVVGFINSCLFKEYDDPVQEMGWNGREGGYQGHTFDTNDLLYDVGLEVKSDELFEDIASNIPTELWCQRHPYQLTEDEELISDWEQFCNFVKTKCRYLFFTHGLTKKGDPWDEKDVPLAYILSFLSDSFTEFGLFKKIKKGTKFYRARYYDKKDPFDIDATNLGPPPSKSAISSRLSAAGISVFYGSDKIETCLGELKIDDCAAVGEFVALEDFYILDLRKLPAPPEIFDDYNPKERNKLKFLRSFLRNITKLIDKDGKEHIEYVPTQIISEFIRFSVVYKRQPIMGIAYPSSTDNSSTSYCLFFGPEACAWNKDEIYFKRKYFLDYVSNSGKVIDAKDLL